MKKQADDFKTFVQDQLAPLPDLIIRPMFGGHGLYQADRFFGILHQGRLYLKTDESGRAEFITRGMSPFQPSPRQTLKNYYQVPVDILEDSQALVSWAKRAIALTAPPDDT